MLPARSTELARIADLHILYRRAASKYAGAITPEVKAQLWAQAEKQVPPLKEKAMIEELRSDMEAHQTDPFENVGPIPTPPPTVDVDALVDAHEPVAIERPGGDATVGTVVISEANPAPAGMVAVQVAPGMIEAAQADEVKTLQDVLNENAALKSEVADLKEALEDMLIHEASITHDRDELKVQLDALKSKPQIFPLGSKPTAQRIAHICPKITEKELEEAWGKRWSFYDSGWTVDPESGAVNYNVVFIETKETVEPKPEDKPTNVRDFPVPDAELTTEDEGKTIASLIVEAAKRRAQETGLPVSSSYGMGRGLAPRRA